MREKIARIIGECGDEYYLQETASPEEIADQILTLFREEIEKLKPLSDEELDLMVYDGKSPKDVVQAQVIQNKEDLRKVME